MPDAIHFSTEGAENGFPNPNDGSNPCVFKVNMLDLNGDGSNVAATKWTTLGNTKKGESPTQAQISLSLKNAMKIYWNLYSVGTEEGTVVIDTMNGDPFEPKDRACRPPGWLKSISRLLVVGSPMRMYDGDIDNEDNFVGYGCGGLTFASREVTGAARIRLNFVSYVAGVDSDFEKSEYNNSFADFYLIAECSSNASADIEISGLTGTITPDNTDLDANSITYSDIDFYTY